jgi:hypothetical protein
MRIASYSLKFFVHYSMPITLGLLSQADFRSTADRQNVTSQAKPADVSPISSDSTDPIKPESSGNSAEIPSNDANSSTVSSSALPSESKSESTSSSVTEPPKIAETPADQTSSSSSPTAENPVESIDPPSQNPSDSILPEAGAAAVSTTLTDQTTSASPTTTDLAPMTSSSEPSASSESTAKVAHSEESSKPPEVISNQALPENPIATGIGSDAPVDSQVPKAEPKPESQASSEATSSTPTSSTVPTSVSQSTSVAETVNVEENAAKSSEEVASVSALAVSAEAVPGKPDHSALPVGYESAQIQTPMESPPMVNSSSETKVESPSGLTTSVVERASPIPETNPTHATSPEVSAPPASEPPKADLKEVQATSTQSSETNAAPAVSPSAGVADIVMPAGFALANEGETWQDVSRRVIGDDRWADLLWKENRDLHHGQFETKPLVGRLIRVPRVKSEDGINTPASEVAIKSN